MKIKLALVSAVMTGLNFTKDKLTNLQQDLKTQEGLITQYKDSDKSVFLFLKGSKLNVIPENCTHEDGANILISSFHTLIKDMDPSKRTSLALDMQNTVGEFIHTEPDPEHVGYAQRDVIEEGLN